MHNWTRESFVPIRLCAILFLFTLAMPALSQASIGNCAVFPAGGYVPASGASDLNFKPRPLSRYCAWLRARQRLPRRSVAANLRSPDSQVALRNRRDSIASKPSLAAARSHSSLASSSRSRCSRSRRPSRTYFASIREAAGSDARGDESVEVIAHVDVTGDYSLAVLTIIVNR
jgi:hypothetical protein